MMDRSYLLSAALWITTDSVRCLGTHHCTGSQGFYCVSSHVNLTLSCSVCVTRMVRVVVATLLTSLARVLGIGCYECVWHSEAANSNDTW